MKNSKVIFVILIFIISGCTSGFYFNADKGGFNTPSLEKPEAIRPSGEYYKFNLSFKDNGAKVRYNVSSSKISSYNEINDEYSSEILIDKDCIISAYSYKEAEVSEIVYYTYSIIKTAPEATQVLTPAGSVDENRTGLRFDQLFYSPITWNDTIGERNLSYLLKFDFDNDGIVDYTINNSKNASLTLNEDQISHLKYNDSNLNIRVDICDNYGGLVTSGDISKYKFTHKKLFSLTPTMELLDAYNTQDNYFISAIGKESTNISINFILTDALYNDSLNIEKSSTITGTILGLSCAYGTNNGAVCFNIESGTDDKVYTIFNIISNTSIGEINSEVDGKGAFIEYYNGNYYLIYMDASNVLNMRKYSEQGVLVDSKVIKNDFSATDNITSFKYKEGRFIIGVEYNSLGVNLFKSLVYDTSFGNMLEFSFNNGRNMRDYTSVLNSGKAGAVWSESSNYYFRTMSVLDSTLSDSFYLDTGTGTKPYVCADNDGFYMVYFKNYSTSEELYFTTVNNAGVKSNSSRITSDAALRNSVRICKGNGIYSFWIEDKTKIAISRIF
jgi:hypothetical protein